MEKNIKVFIAGVDASTLNYVKILAYKDGTWTDVPFPFEAPSIWAMTSDGSNLYAGGVDASWDGQVWKFDGKSWSDMGLKTSSNVYALIIDSFGVLYAGGDDNENFNGQVWTYSSDQRNWQTSWLPLPRRQQVSPEAQTLIQTTGFTIAMKTARCCAIPCRMRPSIIHSSNTRVARLKNQTNMIYTQKYWLQDEKTPSKAVIFEPAHSPMVATYGEIVAPGDEYEIIQMDQMIEPGYWVGMGATQLTCDPMVGFFGWYYNNLAPGAPVASADYKQFVETYLNDGKLGFIGAIWYWMCRVSGQGKPTVHSVLNDPDKPACRDIGGATIGVNGGCNDWEKRAVYYQYFHEKVFKIKIEPVKVKVDGVELNSMECDTNLLKYCVKGSGPTDPTKRCGVDWNDANGRCGRCCTDKPDCPDGESCWQTNKPDQGGLTCTCESSEASLPPGE